MTISEIKIEINKISEKYRKYLILFRIYNKNYFFVSGQDKNEDDMILLDNKKKILLSKDPTKLFEFLKINADNLFDSTNFSEWVKEIQNLTKNQKNQFPSYCIFNFDLLIKSFFLNEPIDYFRIPRKSLKEFVDYINLIGDYAYQTDDKQILRLRKEKNIKFLWDIYYNKYMWTKYLALPPKKIKQIDFDEAIFKKSFQKFLFLSLTKMNFID